MEKNIKVEFWPTHGFGGLEMIVTSFGNGRVYVAKPMNFEFVEVDEGKPIDATLRLNGLMAKEFLQAMADALEYRNIRPSSKPPLENEMTAIRYHLEDMRKLVFK